MEKYTKYLNETIKMKDFDSLLKDELNDSQIEMLKVMVNAVEDYAKNMSSNFKKEEYQNVLSQLYEIYTSIESGIRVMNKRK